MINSEYLSKAQDMLEQKHSELKRVEKERRAEILRKFPEYEVLEEKLAKTVGDLVSTIISKSGNTAVTVNKIKQENLDIQKQMNDILVSNGYDTDYLKPIYFCPICRDEGIIDGDWCTCIKNAALKLATQDLNQSGMLYTFGDFDLSLYSDKIDPEIGCSPREAMKNNLDDCLKFVRDFNGTGRGLFMIGATGLGKTHLSLSIANELLQKGYSVVYNSVPELVRILNSEQFGKTEGDTLQVIDNCDLLILDDLGAEHSTEYSTSLVYMLINSRLSKNKPIIASTNLDMNGIKSRYQDRIWSRLFSMRVLLFCGTDNRIKTANNR